MERLVVRGPDGATAAHPLHPGRPLVIGRDEGCDVVLSSLVVSRRHLQVTLEGAALFVEDLGSRHGTTLAGAPLVGRVAWPDDAVIELGEYTLERRAPSRGPPPAATGVDTSESSVGVLEAVLRAEGSLEGRSVPLSAPVMRVGREQGVEVWVDDDSVSRRHAELRRRTDGRFEVVDLGSANGTFVDGRRLDAKSAVLLAPGVELRFGETRWRLDAPAAVSPRPVRRVVRLAVVAAGTLVVLLAGAWVWLRPPGDEDGPEAAETGAADVAGLRDTAQRQVDEGRYADAVATLGRLVDADPLDPASRTALFRARREVAFEKLYRDAAAASDAGRDVEAVEALLRIDPASGLFTKARLKVQELAVSMRKRDTSACKALKSGVSAETVAACRRLLDHGCHAKADDALAAKFRQVAGTDWSCPAALAPFFRNASAAGADAGQALVVRYPAKELREAMAAYVRGDLEGALRATGKLRRVAGVSEANARLSVVLGRYKEGDAALRTGRPAEARAAFDAALAADAELLPADVRSFHAGEMRRRLSDAFAEAGRAALDRQQHVEAFQQWSTVLAYQAAHPGALDGLAKLERVASSWLSGEPDCEQLRKASRVTVASPSSTAHAKAEGLLAERCTR